MVDISNGNLIHLVNSDSTITTSRHHQHTPGLDSSPDPLLPLSFSSKEHPSHAAVAQFKSRVRRRLGLPSTSTSIMRTIIGALGMASLCLFYLTHSSPPSSIPTRRASSLAVQLVQDHEPIRPGPVDNMTTKYFHEPANHEPGDDELLGHYDIRYFTGTKVSYEERTDTLHHMIRAYLTSLRELNVETWIVHGTLLGWWWNGQILPWDWDLDVQVTGKTLEYMGKWLNGTVHAYKSGDVERRYLLDVNPHSEERVNGDGMNIIDARWIDMRNGLFIDITGISEIEPKERPGIWSCKNYHDYFHKDIWPLKESYFEGVPAMVPFAYDKVLEDEYTNRAFEATTFEGHHWDEKLEKWIADKTLPQSENQTPIAADATKEEPKKEETVSDENKETAEQRDGKVDKMDRKIKSFEDFQAGKH